MTFATATDGTLFGDMNGALAYWGPSAPERTAPVLNPAEQALLLRLRERLESDGSATVTLHEALASLLAEPETALVLA